MLLLLAGINMLGNKEQRTARDVLEGPQAAALERRQHPGGGVADRSDGPLHLQPGRLLQVAVHIQGTAESELPFHMTAACCLDYSN